MNLNQDYNRTMTTTPQAALLSAQNPLLKRCYTMSESHLSGYRVVIGFERLEDAQDAHEYIAKLKATQEPVQSVPEAMKVVTEALRSDPDYAWSWHCNVAMASVDEGMGHYEANQAAARFMRLLAGVDTTKHQGFPEAPEQEPVQAGELPIATDADLDMMDKFAREHNVNAAFFPIDASTLAGFVVSVIDEIRKHRAALSARKPTDAWQDVSACPDGDVWFSLSCGHVVMGYKHGAIFDWEENIDHGCCGDATATKAMPITPPDSHGIGLEVKP